MREFESRPRPQEPLKTTIGSDQIVDLSLAEKQDLVLWRGTPAYAAVHKLLQTMMIELRDEAVTLKSRDPNERLAALDLAAAAATIYERFQEKIIYLIGEHTGRMQLKEAEVAAEDQQMIEEVISSQINMGR